MSNPIAAIANRARRDRVVKISPVGQETRSRKGGEVR